MYCERNFRTKKALKDAVRAGERLGVFSPSLFASEETKNGTAYLEGPHYPAPHTWYATRVVRDGVIVSVK